MNTLTLEEIQKGFLHFCNELHNDMCLINGYTERCPYAEEGGTCEVLYAYDVLTGKRNLDGMLVETSAKEPDATIKLPSWCKVGQWCYLYNELAKITDVEDGIGVWTLSPTQEEPYLTDYTRIHEALKPVRFREYRTMREAQEVKGKWIAWEDVTTSPLPSHNESAITSLCERDGQIEIEGQRIEFWKSVNATIDGVPIGVPELDEDAMKEVE